MGNCTSKVDPYVVRLDANAFVHSTVQEKSNSFDASNRKKPKNGRAALKGAVKAVMAINRMSSSTFGRGKLKMSTSFPWLIKEADYNVSKLSMESIEFKRVIGYGLMGIVRLAKLKDCNGYFAIKSIRKDYVKRHHDDRHIRNEKEILMKLRSFPFCITFFGTFQDNKAIHFAMELAAGGELFRRLNKKENFSSQVSKFYAIEILVALEHIHSLGYVYRDLKPENVMLDENGHCKLVDFGFAALPDSNGLCHTNVGTPAYLSPEQLNGKFTNGYTRIVDWWAFGCFIYELMVGVTPFCKDNRETPYAIYLRVLKGKINFPRRMDSESKDLINQLCFYDVNKRLTEPSVIKDHSYFSVVSSKWDLVKKLSLVPPFVPRIRYFCNMITVYVVLFFLNQFFFFHLIYREDGDDRHFDDYGQYFEGKLEGGHDCLEFFEGF